MPMPTHINGRPVKTGQWTDAEDALLAEWQGKLGNRCTPPPFPWMSRACIRMMGESFGWAASKRESLLAAMGCQQ